MTIRVLVMAGGSSTRMKGTDKLLLKLCDRPLIDWVLEATCMQGECIVATTCQRRPLLEPIASSWGARVLLTPGKGYSADLRFALESLDPPVIIVAGDMPFLTPAFLEQVLRKSMRLKAGLVTVRKCMLRGCEASGISVWRGGWDWANLDLPFTPPLMDIDRWEDYWQAQVYCGFLLSTT